MSFSSGAPRCGEPMVTMSLTSSSQPCPALWAAVQAKERDPGRDVVVLEGDAVAEGASGRNGGFADPSLTHGLMNGLHHFPREMQTLEKLGHENYEGYLEALERHGIDARLERTGSLAVATAAYQLRRSGGRYALCTMCIGVGQGIAMILERV